MPTFVRWDRESRLRDIGKRLLHRCSSKTRASRGRVFQATPSLRTWAPFPPPPPPVVDLTKAPYRELTRSMQPTEVVGIPHLQLDSVAWARQRARSIGWVLRCRAGNSPQPSPEARPRAGARPRRARPRRSPPSALVTAGGGMPRRPALSVGGGSGLRLGSGMSGVLWIIWSLPEQRSFGDCAPENSGRRRTARRLQLRCV